MQPRVPWTAGQRLPGVGYKGHGTQFSTWGVACHRGGPSRLGALARTPRLRGPVARVPGLTRDGARFVEGLSVAVQAACVPACRRSQVCFVPRPTLPQWHAVAVTSSPVSITVTFVHKAQQHRPAPMTRVSNFWLSVAQDTLRASPPSNLSFALNIRFLSSEGGLSHSRIGKVKHYL